MDETSYKSSSDSMSTSGEFEIVSDNGAAAKGMTMEAEGGTKEEEKRGAVVSLPLNLSSPDTASIKTGLLATSPPTLNIANNGDMMDLEQNLKEIIREIEKSPLESDSVVDKASSIFERSPEDATLSRAELQQKYGRSVFYDCLDASPTTTTEDTTPTEKQDDMKQHTENNTEEDLSEIDQECTIFSGVTYLGAGNINAPKSNMELQRKMSEMNQSSDDVGLRVTVSIPNCSDGFVVLHDAATSAHIAAYEVTRILFYSRGTVGTSDEACFSFTLSRGDCQETAIFQCHVFRCHIPEAVSQVSVCFSRAFERRPPPSLSASMIVDSPEEKVGAAAAGAISNSPEVNQMTVSISSPNSTPHPYEFMVALEIKEKLTKTSSSYCAVPRDKSTFKVRANCNKQIVISISQKASKDHHHLPPLTIERCFGVLLSPGKLVRLADMHLLDFEVIGQVTGTDGDATSSVPAYQVVAEWRATDKSLQRFNVETPRTDLTVAIDLVVRGIQDPVRFVIETTVQVQSKNELRIMDQMFSSASSQKRALACRFPLNLRALGDGQWQVIPTDAAGKEQEDATVAGVINSVTGVDVSPVATPTGGTTDRNSFLSKMGIDNITKLVRSQSIVSIDGDLESVASPTDYSSDGDEPMVSGTGEVSREMTQDALDEWGRYMHELQTDSALPKGVPNLVRAGIPEAIRGNVWLKLAGMDQREELIDNYRVLITRETTCEGVIRRDINRTFPVHKFFKESGGAGQDALYKVSKAYAVYDTEVGYCQGLSFIAASLLLHMPEEDAFCVLVALMHKYKLRDLYRDGFESLYLRLFQLDCLMRDHLPKLHSHFQEVGIETHMFASQWFLTLYTARFPLYVVFHILDLFLLDGMGVLFQVALTLLATCESDLRQLDFEGILQYFRLQLPRKCRGQGHAKRMMKAVCERKVKHLKKYEDKFREKREAEERQEQETAMYEAIFGEERRKLQAEIKRLEGNLVAAEEASATLDGIIGEYKQINLRQEQQLTELNGQVEELVDVLCRSCAQRVPTTMVSLHKQLVDKWGLEGDVLDGGLGGEEGRPFGEGSLGPLDPLSIAQQRIRELELELAQTKLAHVEAECQKQSLNHQLNNTMQSEAATALANQKTSWQPWLSKKFNTIQEKVRKDLVQAGAGGGGGGGVVGFGSGISLMAGKEEGGRKLTEERRTGSVDEGTAKAATQSRSSAEGSKMLAAMESMSFDYK